MIDLSVVIVSFNTCDITLQCLESVANATAGIRCEVIVVDNASADGSADAVAERFAEARLIRNDRNAGFAAGQNIGLARARGRYLMVLNSDAVLIGDAGKALVDFLDTAPGHIGVVGPQVRNSDGSIAPSARRALMPLPMVALGIVNRHFPFKRLLPEELMRRYAGNLLGRWHDNYAAHETVRRVDFVDGICAVFRREALADAGLFDEQFFFDFEIHDLSNRIRASGWEIVFNPLAQVVHLAHSSRGKVSRIIVETHRSELRYYAKYAPEMVPRIRRVTHAVVSMRRKLAQLRRDGERVELYGEILQLVETFDPQSVSATTTIPRLATAHEAAGRG